MSTQTETLGLTLPAWEEGFDLDDWNGNSQIIDTFAGQITAQVAAKVSRGDLAAVATSGSYSDLTGKPELAAVATSGNYNDLTNKPSTDAAPTEDSTNAVQSGGVFTALAEKADTAAVFGTGTLIPNDGDLFTLPVGKYYRNTNPTVIANIPSDLTVAFYCEIVNTIADNRRKIYLYPATVQTAGVFYTCLETGSGYGAWYKFTGEAVV